MNFDVLITDSVHGVPSETWDLANRGKPFASSRWYSYCEKVLSGCQPVHILLYRSGEVAGHASFWLMRQDVLPLSSTLSRWAGEWMLHRWPLLVCRSPVANVTGLVLPDSRRSEAFRAIAETAEAQGKKMGVSFLLYDYMDASEFRAEALPAQYGWMEVTDPGTALDICWESFDHYLTDMPKSVWKDFRRHNNQASKLGIEVSLHASVPDIQEALALIRCTEKRHGTMANPWAEQVLQQMHMVEGTWLEARKGGRLVGCGLLVRDGDHLVATQLGLDYAVKYAYFQVLYSAIQYAIEQGVRVFHAGSGAYELKQRLGFTLEQNNNIAFAGIGPVFSKAVRFGGRWTGTNDAMEMNKRVQC